jgi:glutaredoxin
MKAKAIIALCALLAAIPASAQVHRWVDADGKVHYSNEPPPEGVKAKPVPYRINSFSAPPVVSGAPSPAARPGQARPEIKMYATSWCPYCRRAQAYFAQRGIAYTHIDIEKSPIGQAEYRGLGGRGVPLITVGTQRMNGFSEENLAQMLKAAGY